MQNIKEFIAENWKNTVRYNPKDEGTLLGLPKPYTVPCVSDHFQEMYYWDTYFANVGLLISGDVEQAKNNADDMAFLIEKYGFMPNGSRTQYLTRSQPPFFTQMVREIYEVTRDKAWLAEMYGAAEKEYVFFTEKRASPSGLFCYTGHCPPEKLAHSYENICRRLGLDAPKDEETAKEYSRCSYSFCESGWDCNSRFGMRAHKFNPVDLSSLVYNMADNLSFFASELGNEKSAYYACEAARIKACMNQLCYDGKMFCDYDFERCERSPIFSAAMFYPLFFGIATKEQAEETIKLLPKLEAEYGVTGTEKIENGMNLQWDYPQGWACLQYIVVKALEKYGHEADARRIAAKYCKVVEINYEKTGSLWEKYEVVNGEVAKDREHLGVLIKMMGWSAGVYLYCDSVR